MGPVVVYTDFELTRLHGGSCMERIRLGIEHKVYIVCPTVALYRSFSNKTQNLYLYHVQRVEFFIQRYVVHTRRNGNVGSGNARARHGCESASKRGQFYVVNGEVAFPGRHG